MRAALVVTLALAAGFGASLMLGGCRRGKPDWRIVQLYGGAGSIQAISEPTRVEAFRIEAGVSNAEPGVERIGLHRATSAAVTVDDLSTTELTSILTDPDTYEWHSAKGCEFRPGVGLRFTRHVSRVDVALCFECDMLTVHREGRRVGVEDFDDARPRLVAIAKQLFPADEDIQALQ